MVADAMVKKAPVRILEAAPVCPGKYLVLVAGEVAPVESSMKIGLEAGGAFVIDQLLLTQVHSQVVPAILAVTDIEGLDALGIIETFSMASSIAAADKAAKIANIKLIEIRLAKGLGGKAYITLTGELAEVEAAVAAGVEYVASKGLLVNKVIIPAPHIDLVEKIL